MTTSTFKLSMLAVICSILVSCGTSNSSFNNMVATVQVKEPMEGICDNSKVYAILPFDGNGQEEAEHAMSNEQLIKRLNEEVQFLSENSSFNSEGMINVWINCKGQLVKVETDKETGTPELDKQILSIFRTLEKWSPATMHGTPVDSMLIYSFEIKDGKFVKLD